MNQPGELLEDQFAELNAVEQRLTVKKKLGYNIPTKTEYFGLPNLKEKTIFDEIDRSLQALKRENERRDQLEISHYRDLKAECKRLEEKVQKKEAQEERQLKFEDKIEKLVLAYRNDFTSHKQDLIEIVDNRLAKISGNYEKILTEKMRHETDVSGLKEESLSHKIEINTLFRRFDGYENDHHTLKLRVSNFDVNKADQDKVDLQCE